jgi:hemerythrin
MLIDKNNIPLVAMDFMNQAHLEDVDIINNLYSEIASCTNIDAKSKTKINDLFQEWIEHTKKHFLAEEQEMLSNNFPPYMFHKSEHDSVMARMHEIYDTWNKSNDINMIRDYFENELVQWLINHINSMDTVTAMFLKTGLSPCAMR